MDAVTLCHYHGYTTSFHPVAGLCSVCQSMHHIFINRDGKSACLYCDKDNPYAVTTHTP